MTLHDPVELRAFLKRHGIRAEKGLGQHFLISASAVNAIVDAVGVCPGVLEIGPGPGVLTQPLSERAERVIALELDGRMVTLLETSSPKADVRRVDALQTDLAQILEELPRPRAIVSNLPYYITGPLLQRIAECRDHIDGAVLMMQKEVALRVIAPAGDGERGSLSVFLQAHFDIRRVANVHATAFLPPPKVDSIVLGFTPRAIGLTQAEEAATFRIIKFGFTQPRKTLANNLVAGLHLERDPIIDIIEAVGLSEKVRAQDLTFDQWIELARALPAQQ